MVNRFSSKSGVGFCLWALALLLWVAGGTQVSFGATPWIYGIHDTDPVPTEFLNRAGAAGKTVWITSTVAVGHNPSDQGGQNYTQFSNAGHTVICRINNDYYPSGTIPVPAQYANFGQRCANFVANTQGCDIFVIGNETNLWVEWPAVNGYHAYVSPQDYANCFRECYNRIKAVRPNAQVLCQALGPFGGPYGSESNHDAMPIGWTTYMNQMLTAIAATGGIDGIAVHINSRGYTFADVHSTQQVNGQFFSFYVYKDWVNLGTPASLRSLPYYATECNGIYYWKGGYPECVSCGNASCCYQNDWVKWIYNEINAWNQAQAASGEGIYRCVNMYRWCSWCDGWNIDSSPQKGNILDDFDESYALNYQWPASGGGGGATPTPTPTALPGTLLSQGKPVTTDSNFDGTLVGAKMVDGVIAGNGNRWVSGSAGDSHHWFHIDLQSGYNLTSFELYSGEANGESIAFNVKTFTVRGSNTGTGAVNTWTQIASWTSASNDYPGTGVNAKVTLTLSGNYRYVGVDITCSDIDCGAYARVQEARVFGNAAGATSTPTRTPTPAPTSTPITSKGLSLDPGAPISASSGNISFAGNLIQDSGAKWVRINFILGPWSSPGDSTPRGSQNLSWFATYDQIVNDAIARGLTVYGLVGAEAVHSGNPLNSNGYVQDYVNNFVAIVDHFKDRVRYYESFNEPNDWAGGSSAQVTPFYFAKMIEDIYRAVKIDNGHLSDPAWQVTLVSGPLFTHDQDTGASYFTDTANAGKNQLGWTSFRNTYGKYPLDGVGYHIYVKQGTANVSQVQSGMNTNLNAIWSSVTNLDGTGTSLKLWVSEIGWNSASVSENDQATNVGTAIDLLAADNRVAFISWFCLRDFGSPNFWGLERGDGSKKPAWSTFVNRAGGFGGATPTPTRTPTRTNTPLPTNTPTATPACSQRVANGDFSGGSASWTNWAQRGSATRNFASSNIPTGGTSPCYEMSSTDFNGGIYQAVNLVSGQQYTINILSRDVNSVGTWCEVLIGTAAPVNGQDYVAGNPAGTIVLKKWEVSVCDNWNTGTGCVTNLTTFTASASTMYIVLKAGQVGSSNMDVSFDNVQICGPAPGPTSTPTRTPTRTPTPTPTNTPSGPIAQENFDSMPSWNSTYDASWGGSATWSIVSGGQAGNAFQVSRSNDGSSVRVKVYTVPTNTNITLSGYMRSNSGTGYWAEFAYKFGSFTAQDFDTNAGTWTMIRKFSNSGTNGNGNVWTNYSSSTVNTGSNTQVSVGYKLGRSGGTAPVVQWDTFRIQ